MILSRLTGVAGASTGLAWRRSLANQCRSIFLTLRDQVFGSPDPASVCGLPCLAGKRRLKLGYILQDTDHAKLTRWVRVNLRAQARRFFALVLAPNLAKRKEEARLKNKPVDLRSFWVPTVLSKGRQRDANATIIGDIFPESERA